MKHKRRWLWLLALLPILLALPLPVVSKLEERDGFCASCHLAPEETYVARAQAALDEEAIPADLASDHYALAEAPFRCIDCHRGSDSPRDRLHTLQLGARDALIWISGQADQTLEKTTSDAPGLLEASCLKCHLETLVELGFNNHYHSQLPQAKAAEEAGLKPTIPPHGLTDDPFTILGESPTTLTCLDCHQAHRNLPDGDRTLYLDVDNVLLPACEQCHREAGGG